MIDKHKNRTREVAAPVDSRYVLVKIVNGLAKNREESNKKEKVLFMKNRQRDMGGCTCRFFPPLLGQRHSPERKTQGVQNPDAWL